MIFSDDASGFVSIGEVIPDALLDIRYYSSFNFIGERIDGYEEAAALLTREAAEALKKVSDEAMGQGWRLKIFDAYRPQKAVDHFVRWAKDPLDIRMKQFFYPELEKKDIIPQHYIAEHSGHSRGSTVDLTLFDMASQQDADMGGMFDYFGERSHPDFAGITEKQHQNRMLLQKLMVKHGFRPLDSEWWHFSLENEPYADTYFTFPVNRASVVPGVPPKKTENRPVSSFREMRRFKQKISEAECIAVLENEKRGVLSVLGEGGYPYGIPMNHWYCAEDGKIYFHGAKEGHKLDAVRKCGRVSYCVYDAGYRREGEWSLNVKSVVIFGRMRLVEDGEKAAEICTQLCRRFTDDEAYLQRELENALPRVQCLELTIEHMTGKLVNES